MPRIKKKYNLDRLDDVIMDRFGGIGGFADYWMKNDPKVLSDIIKERVKRVKVDADLKSEVVIKYLYAKSRDELTAGACELPSAPKQITSGND